MSEPDSLSIDGYNPYESGWYLLPVEPAKVEWYSGLGLTQDQVDEINSHTLQGLIELVYVRVGNDVLFSGLNGLDTALEATTQTLEILSSVQELHNALVTSSLGSFSAWFKFEGDYSSAGRFESNYNSVASAFFGVPIIPDFIFSSAGGSIDQGGTELTYKEFAEKLAEVRGQLSAQVVQLGDLALNTPDFTDPNSLYNTTKKVLSDLPPIINDGVNAAPIAWSDAKLWAMDFYGAYEGQDLAQARPTQYVIKYAGSRVPQAWTDVSLSPGRQIGMGTGFREVNTDMTNRLQIGGNFQSVRLVTHGGLMPAQGGNGEKGTFVLTFSGRLAIGWNEGGGAPTMLMINPLKPQGSGDVVNPIEGNQRPTGAMGVTDIAGEKYIGTFGGVTRGQAQNAGAFEQNITLAMTAAQGLNNTQTEQVRGYLFTFEEYYKSASSVLSSLTQLIQKYAQGIRPA